MERNGKIYFYRSYRTAKCHEWIKFRNNDHILIKKILQDVINHF